jgi:hypothetical protein
MRSLWRGLRDLRHRFAVSSEWTIPSAEGDRILISDSDRLDPIFAKILERPQFTESCQLVAGTLRATGLAGMKDSDRSTPFDCLRELCRFA